MKTAQGSPGQAGAAQSRPELPRAAQGMPVAGSGRQKQQRREKKKICTAVDIKALDETSTYCFDFHSMKPDATAHPMERCPEYKWELGARTGLKF